MTVKIHAIRTGSVQIKTAQMERQRGGLMSVLAGAQWTEWLPIYAWVIDHPEGVIVVDTGETARTGEAGYFPVWHPYYRMSVRMDVQPEDEIGPQLRHMGVGEDDVRTVVLTHFHTDHTGGLHHFAKSEILVSGEDWMAAKGLSGKLQGFLPQRWPAWFAPTPIAFETTGYGPFDSVYSVTQAGDVLVVSTPGHTANHLSVIVFDDDVAYFLAGDTSYTQRLLLERKPDGVSPKVDVALSTIDRILLLAQEQPTVYLPSHDPDSASRLASRTTV